MAKKANRQMAKASLAGLGGLAEETNETTEAIERPSSDFSQAEANIRKLLLGLAPPQQQLILHALRREFLP